MPGSQTFDAFLHNLNAVLPSRKPHQIMALARLTVAAHAINRYPTMRVIMRVGAVDSTYEGDMIINQWRKSAGSRAHANPR